MINIAISNFINKNHVGSYMFEYALTTFDLFGLFFLKLILLPILPLGDKILDNHKNDHHMILPFQPIAQTILQWVNCKFTFY